MFRGDKVLLISIGIFLVFGLLMLTSASGPTAYRQFGDSFFFLKRQILHGILPGLAGFFILSRVNYRHLKKMAPIFYVLALIFLVGVLLPGLGQSYGKTQSWMRLGPLSFQPAELVKIFFIVALAAYFSIERGENKPPVLPFLVLLGGVAGLLVLQPDIGTMSVLVVFSLAMYFAANASFATLGGLFTFGVLFFGWIISSAPYRAKRFMIFLHPELDPSGVGYHINQALLAVGSGGLFGLGLGHSRQKFQYLPEVYGDSIFAIIAEELGFLLAAGVIVLFLFIIWRGLKIAEAAPDKFGSYLAVGITSWVAAQTFLNIGSMIGVTPLTGLPLPFVSYGGSAMVALLSAMGILFNIGEQSQVKRRI